MKLAVFEISRFDESALRRWSRDPDCVILSVNRPGDCQFARPPVEMTPYEAIAQRHVRLYEPLFDAGARNEGPRLAGAEVSFLGAADFTLFIESRFPTALLLDLERLLGEHRIERVEFVTDLADGAKYRSTVRAFAQAHRLPLSESSLVRPRRGFARSASRAIDLAAEAVWSHAPAYLEVAKTRARRWIHARRWPASATQTGQHRPPRDVAVRAAMLVYHPKSWRYLLPIRRALIEAGHDVLLISPRLESDKALEAAGVEFVSLPTAMPDVTLRNSVADYLGHISWRSDDKEFDALVRESGALRLLTVQGGVAACSAYANVALALPRLLERHRVNVVLGTDWGSVAGRCFQRCATRLGAESVFIQHGSVGVLAGAREYMLDAYRLLWGADSVQTLSRQGVCRPERNVAFGSPFHEERYGLLGDTQLSGEPSSKRTVLTTFGVPGGYVAEGAFRRAAAAVMAAAAEFKDVSFLIKPHPGDPGRVWRQIVADRDLANVQICTDRDTYDLMRECDLLLTMFSTTGSEAICMGKPVVSINPDDRQAGEEYLNAGAAYSVRGDDDLIAVLGHLFAVPSGMDRLAQVRLAYSRSFFHREDLPAAKRAVEFLERLVTSPLAQMAHDH